MRAILSALSVAMLFVATLYDNNYLVSPNKIIWSDSVSLSWDNFGGMELPGKSYPLQTQLSKSEHIGFLAQTETGIVYTTNGNSYDVQAVFFAGRSFYKIYSDTLKPSAYSLRHELYHFHLTELYARYLRKDLALLGKPTPREVDSMYEKHIAGLDSASAAYDKFTRHANIVGNQKHMEQVIDSLLVVTSNYKRNY